MGAQGAYQLKTAVSGPGRPPETLTPCVPFLTPVRPAAASHPRRPHANTTAMRFASPGGSAAEGEGRTQAARAQPQRRRSRPSRRRARRAPGAAGAAGEHAAQRGGAGEKGAVSAQALGQPQPYCSKLGQLQPFVAVLNTGMRGPTCVFFGQPKSKTCRAAGREAAEEGAAERARPPDRGRPRAG